VLPEHPAPGVRALDLSGLVLDTTNFATFIDTGNLKAPIAQRGKAKQNAPQPSTASGCWVSCCRWGGGAVD